MFVFTHSYPADSPAMVLALSAILLMGIIGLGFIIWEFFRK